MKAETLTVSESLLWGLFKGNNMESYKIYKHTTPNGKVYIGQTRNDLSDRWKNGKGYTCHRHGFFWKAIEKYGWDNIQHELLEDGLSKEEADSLEKHYIELYKSNLREFGYNSQTGGSSGYQYTEESKKKISEGLKRHYEECGKPNTEKARRVLQEKQKRAIAQYDLQGNLIAIYDSALEAYEKTGVSNKNINHVVRSQGRIKQTGGFMWRYAEDAPDKITPYSNGIKVFYIDERTNILGVYENCSQASKATGICKSTIGNILKKRYKTSQIMNGKSFVYGVLLDDNKLTVI